MLGAQAGEPLSRAAKRVCEALTAERNARGNLIKVCAQHQTHIASLQASNQEHLAVVARERRLSDGVLAQIDRARAILGALESETLEQAADRVCKAMAKLCVRAGERQKEIAGLHAFFREIRGRWPEIITSGLVSFWERDKEAFRAMSFERCCDPQCDFCVKKEQALKEEAFSEFYGAKK
jgi:Xaa-Pro aminopeptidase